MKIKIRQGVFETNSSTMHSIVITKNTEKSVDDFYPSYKYNYQTGKCDDTILCLDCADDFYFGRHPFKILSSFENKMCYAFSFMFTGECFEEELKNCEAFKKAKETLLKAIQEKFPKVKDIEFPHQQLLFYELPNGELTEYINRKKFNKRSEENEDWLINEETGEVVKEVLRTVYDFGYNESTLNFNKFLEKYKITLAEFIFNPKYVVIIDGDEYCVFKDMKALIGKENIVAEFGEFNNEN